MPDHKLHILGFAGSLRRESYNRGLLRAAAADLPQGVSMEIFDLSVIPPYNMDLEDHDDTPEVRAFKEAIRRADALLLAIPEHNYSFSGTVKNAIDWASRPFVTSVLLEKPVAIMGASTGRMGTARAQHAIRPVLAATGCYVMIKPELYVSQAAKVCDEDGNVTDEATQKRVRRMVDALVEWTHRLCDQRK
ncbi:MAG: NAD(P)H-dependent oxidoreductase [Actinobacteria bacterium]|nr:NAD(P)H-dependent oxidoreductase [Actinomycetota bacterium]